MRNVSDASELLLTFLNAAGGSADVCVWCDGSPQDTRQSAECTHLYSSALTFEQTNTL